MEGWITVRGRKLKMWKNRYYKLIDEPPYLMKRWKTEDTTQAPSWVHDLKQIEKCEKIQNFGNCEFQLVFKTKVALFFRLQTPENCATWVEFINKVLTICSGVEIVFEKHDGIKRSFLSANQVSLENLKKIFPELGSNFFLEKRFNRGEDSQLIFPRSSGRFRGLTKGERYHVVLTRPQSLLEKENLFIPLENLIFTKEIDAGGGGSIQTAQWCGKTVVVKSIHPNPEMEESFESEFYHSAVCRHPNIIKLFGWSEQIQEPINKKYLVMEWLPMGNLKSALFSNTDKTLLMDWSLFFKLALDIVSGMIYLHRKSIIHHDIKLENIMLDVGAQCSEENQIITFNPKLTQLLMCKIIDFGISQCGVTIDGNPSGTPGYIAPELYKKKSADEKGQLLKSRRKLANAVDVFAFGFVLYSMLTLKDAYENISFHQRQQKILNNEFPEIPAWIPEELKEIITRCWSINPEERPSFQRIQDTLINSQLTIIKNNPPLFLLASSKMIPKGKEIFSSSQVIPVFGQIKVSLIYEYESRAIGVSLSIQGNCILFKPLLSISHPENDELIEIHSLIPNEETEYLSSEDEPTEQLNRKDSITFSLSKRELLKLIRLGSETSNLYQYFTIPSNECTSIVITIQHLQFALYEEPHSEPSAIKSPKINLKISHEFSDRKEREISQKEISQEISNSPLPQKECPIVITNGEIEMKININPIYEQSISFGNINQTQSKGLPLLYLAEKHGKSSTKEADSSDQEDSEHNEVEVEAEDEFEMAKKKLTQKKKIDLEKMRMDSLLVIHPFAAKGKPKGIHCDFVDKASAINFVLLGSRKSGKSTFLQRFNKINQIQTNTFDDYTGFTSTLDNKEKYKTFIWKTKNMQANSITSNYFRYKHSFYVIFIDFSMFSESLEAAKFFIEKIQQSPSYSARLKNVVILLNKIDKISHSACLDSVANNEDFVYFLQNPSILAWLPFSCLNNNSISLLIHYLISSAASCYFSPSSDLHDKLFNFAFVGPLG